MISALVAALAASAACDTGEETTDGSTSDASGNQSAQGGTPSVASSTTTVGVGGAGANTSFTCFGGYTDIPTGTCDLLNQNCPAGYGCEAVQGGSGFTTECVVNGGLKGPGDACVNESSCRAGLYCVQGKCSSVCCPVTNEPCGVGGLCILNVNFGPHSAELCFYPESCALFAAACGAGEKCYPLMDDGNSVCAQANEPTAGEGETCSAINDCDDSMLCDGGTCRWACFLDGDGLAPGAGGCPAGQTCRMVGMSPPANVGVCG